MSQIDGFLTALKTSLKEKNLTYRDIAKELDLSESSIKRILANKSISLQRVEEICRIADIKFTELVKVVQYSSNEDLFYLSEQQERALAQNMRLLQFYVMLCEGHSPENIFQDYDLPQSEMQKYLFQLDRLNLLELHLQGKIKLKKSGNLRFRRDGPIGRQLFSQAKLSYLSYNFGQEDFLRFSLIKVSGSTLTKYRLKMENILKELQEEAEFEEAHNVDGIETGFLMAFRPWRYSFMDAINLKSSRRISKT